MGAEPRRLVTSPKWWIIAAVCVGIVIAIVMRMTEQDPYGPGTEHDITIERDIDCTGHAWVRFRGWTWRGRPWAWPGVDAVQGTFFVQSGHEASFRADDGRVLDFEGGKGDVFFSADCAIAP